MHHDCMKDVKKLINSSKWMCVFSESLRIVECQVILATRKPSAIAA